MDGRGRPWTPEEAVPEDGWPPAPDAVPIVVREWALLTTGAACPDLPTTGGFAAAFKRDWSARRAERFAAAWRVFQRDGATPEAVDRLHRARVLRPLKRRGG